MREPVGLRCQVAARADVITSQHVSMDAKTEAEDHAGKLCDLARCEMSGGTAVG